MKTVMVVLAREWVPWVHKSNKHKQEMMATLQPQLQS